MMLTTPNVSKNSGLGVGMYSSAGRKTTNRYIVFNSKRLQRLTNRDENEVSKSTMGGRSKTSAEFDDHPDDVIAGYDPKRRVVHSAKPKDILAMTGYMATARYNSMHRKTSSFATVSRDVHFKYYVKNSRKQSPDVGRYQPKFKAIDAQDLSDSRDLKGPEYKEKAQVRNLTQRREELSQQRQQIKCRRILGQKSTGHQKPVTRKSSMDLLEDSLSPSPAGGDPKLRADDDDAGIITPPPRTKEGQHSKIEDNRVKTPRFGHKPGPLMAKSMARPPFVDERKGPNDKRFEIIETGELMTKNKRVPSFSIERMSPRKPIGVRQHFLQDYTDDPSKSISKNNTLKTVDLTKMSERGRRLSIYESVSHNPEPDSLKVQKCYLNLGRRSPKIDISKLSPRDDKIYTNTEMYRNALRENELFDEIKEYLFDGETLDNN